MAGKRISISQKKSVHDAIADICIRVPTNEEIKYEGAKTILQGHNEDNLLVRIKHRIMNNKCLSGGRDASSKHKMMIIAHVEQHSIGPHNICYKFIPRMLAFPNQSYG